MEGGRRLNIYDIAREAGVSIATISRVVNGKGTVSEKTRRKVEAVLVRYHYMPDQIARGLVTKSTRTVAVMTIDIRDIYYANVAYTIEQGLSRYGYNVLLCNTGDDTQEKLRYIRSVIQKKVDSIVFVGSVFKDEALDNAIRSVAARIPVIMVNGFLDAENVYSIICGDREGIIRAVQYLAAKGRTRPVYFKDADTFSARSKVDGFIAAVGEEAADRVIHVNRSIEGGTAGVEDLLGTGRAFDSVICGDDITAVGAVKCLRRHGVEVPGKVAVIGFNDSLLAECCDPALTSVDGQMTHLGRVAVETLIHVLSGEGAQRRIVFTPVIRLRESS